MVRGELAAISAPNATPIFEVELLAIK